MSRKYKTLISDKRPGGPSYSARIAPSQTAADTISQGLPWLYALEHPESKSMPDIAVIMSVPQAIFKSYKVGGLNRENATLHSHLARDDAPWWDYSTRPVLT
ncbi:hypothetical protein MY10362_002399 [Beauveria mimosiformis]